MKLNNKLKLHIIFVIAIMLSINYSSVFAQTIELFELQKKCALEAKKYFIENKKTITSPTTREIITTEYHFNRKKSICLLRVKRTPNSGPFFVGDSIYNVLENKLLTLLYIYPDEKNRIFTCIIKSEKTCTNEIEYMQEAEQLMSD